MNKYKPWIKFLLILIVMFYQLIATGSAIFHYRQSIALADSKANTVAALNYTNNLETRMTVVEQVSTRNSIRLDYLEKSNNSGNGLNIENRLTRVETQNDTLHSILNPVAVGVLLLVAERMYQAYGYVRYIKGLKDKDQEE